MRDGKFSGYVKKAVRWIARSAAVPAGIVLTGFILAGCGVSEESKYTPEETDVAKLEVYEAGSDTLLKTIEDEETLYRFDQVSWVSGDDDTEWEWESEPVWPEELKETVKNIRETYNIVVYKDSVAKFGNKEPVKILTITLYENTNIARILVAEDAAKNFSMLEEYLTFYYEMPEQESEFYASLP